MSDKTAIEKAKALARKTPSSMKVVALRNPSTGGYLLFKTRTPTKHANTIAVFSGTGIGTAAKRRKTK